MLIVCINCIRFTNAQHSLYSLNSSFVLWGIVRINISSLLENSGVLAVSQCQVTPTQASGGAKMTIKILPVKILPVYISEESL